MKPIPRIASLLLALVVCQAQAAPPGTAPSVADVTELGLVNGQALACGEQDTSERARRLMIERAPPTPEYGAAFEQATQQGFMAQIKGEAACPARGVLALRIEALSARLRAARAAGD